jgi:hypothetical protein
VRQLVYQRDDWRCVCCGESVIGRPHSLGHRLRRSQGGRHVPGNLLTFLGLGNGLTGKDDHHYRIDQRSDPHDEARGFTVRSNEDPALVPVMVHGDQGGALAWPTDDGRWVYEPPGGAA